LGFKVGLVRWDVVRVKKSSFAIVDFLPLASVGSSALRQILLAVQYWFSVFVVTILYGFWQDASYPYTVIVTCLLTFSSFSLGYKKEMRWSSKFLKKFEVIIQMGLSPAIMVFFPPFISLGLYCNRRKSEVCDF